MKSLVVYYSNEGNTEAAAQRIATELPADLLKLLPEKDIPAQGFFRFFTGGMRASFGMGTKLQPYRYNFAEYDQVILGTPIWASGPVPAINQFLKENPDTSKFTAAFTCSGGGDNAKCVTILSKKIPGLKNVVALADHNQAPLAAGNDAKLEGFIANLRKS